jgi:hypothetical protein
MATPSIVDLTNAMEKLGQFGGGKDLQLSESARQNYVNHIQTFRTKLATQRDNAGRLDEYQEVGGFNSAQQTKFQLQQDAVEVVDVLTNYISYLDELEKAVNAAFSRFQAEDQSS